MWGDVQQKPTRRPLQREAGHAILSLPGAARMQEVDRGTEREDKKRAWLDVEMGGEGMLKVPLGFWLGLPGTPPMDMNEYRRRNILRVVKLQAFAL